MVQPRIVQVIALAAVAVASGCASHGTVGPEGAPPAVTAPLVGPPGATLPMSDPAEYQIEAPSVAAGEAIFLRTGIGDPYRTGIPYPMLLALMRGYPQVFGATSQELAVRFGMIARAAVPDSDDLDLREGLPVGMHLTIDPITRVPFVVNACALCHAAAVRWPGGQAIVTGLGSKRIQIHAYDAAFAAVTTMPGFSAERLGRLAGEAATAHHVRWTGEFAQTLAEATVSTMRRRAGQRAALHAATTDGPPGRVAVIESFAVMMAQYLGRPVPTAPQVGWSKVPDVVGFGKRSTLSWDGIGTGPLDVLVVEADFAAGARLEWFFDHPLQGASLSAYLRSPAAQARPRYPGAIDRKAAARGKALFDEHCSDCHGHYRDDGSSIDYEESIVALADIGTDPDRSRAVTAGFIAAANDRRLTRGLTKTEPSTGYVPPVLTGVWLRAPYGHNGQWATLRMLATPPAQRWLRYKVFYDDPYDLDAVGVSAHADDQRFDTLAPVPFVYDGDRAGFDVGGHPFLADLGHVDAAAVIEYLKTL